jgi:DNA repair ATPase RecN
MSDKKKIDEKLAELCASIKEFSSLTDRTKAIETLAKKMATVGEEHLSEAQNCSAARRTIATPLVVEFCPEIINIFGLLS